jgi:hypothetical protein
MSRRVATSAAVAERRRLVRDHKAPALGKRPPCTTRLPMYHQHQKIALQDWEFKTDVEDSRRRFAGDGGGACDLSLGVRPCGFYLSDPRARDRFDFKHVLLSSLRTRDWKSFLSQRFVYPSGQMGSIVWILKRRRTKPKLGTDETHGTVLPPDLSPPEWTGLRRGRDGRPFRAAKPPAPPPSVRALIMWINPPSVRARMLPAARTYHAVRPHAVGRPSLHAAGRPRLPLRTRPHASNRQLRSWSAAGMGVVPFVSVGTQGWEWCRSSPSGQARKKTSEGD